MRATTLLLDAVLARTLGVPRALARELRLAAGRSVPQRQYLLRAGAFLLAVSPAGRLIPLHRREQAIGSLVRPALIGTPARMAYTGIAPPGPREDPCHTLIR